MQWRYGEHITVTLRGESSGSAPAVTSEDELYVWWRTNTTGDCHGTLTNIDEENLLVEQADPPADLISLGLLEFPDDINDDNVSDIDFTVKTLIDRLEICEDSDANGTLDRPKTGNFDIKLCVAVDQAPLGGNPDGTIVTEGLTQEFNGWVIFSIDTAPPRSQVTSVAALDGAVRLDLTLTGDTDDITIGACISVCWAGQKGMIV
ncbi:MAG: hypothetical protein R3C68_09115 [Myxococcota bacterium]